MQPASRHRVVPDGIMLVTLGCLATVVSLATLAPPAATFAAVLGWCMAAISISDARRFIVPDVLSLPAIPLGLLASAVVDTGKATSFGLPFAGPSIGAPAPDHLLGMVMGAATFMLIRVGYRHFRGREGLGLGDVKLAAVAGAWNGTEGVLHVVLLACIAALIVVSTGSLISYACSATTRPTPSTSPPTTQPGTPPVSPVGTNPPARNAMQIHQVMTTAIPFGAFLAPAIWLVYIARAMANA